MSDERLVKQAEADWHLAAHWEKRFQTTVEERDFYKTRYEQLVGERRLIPMNVRAKFRVAAVRRSLWNRGQEVQTIELQPVTGGSGESEENQQFYAATPSGKIELGCVNAAAATAFELGAEFYVDFTRADG